MLGHTKTTEWGIVTRTAAASKEKKWNSVKGKIEALGKAVQQDSAH